LKKGGGRVFKSSPSAQKGEIAGYIFFMLFKILGNVALRSEDSLG
jgi:hypothetical protein